MQKLPPRITNIRSLGSTIDAINAASFDGNKLSSRSRGEAASWIAGRVGETGSYEGMPAPTKADFAAGVTVFTGEHVASRAGTAHILGQEACRALRMLGASRASLNMLEQANARMLARLEASRARGIYCCGTCSVAMWRNIVSGAFDRREERLAHGLQELRRLRKGDGRWQKFPFYYTLLALTELDLSVAIEEMRYVAPTCERLLRRPAKTGHDRRRHEVLRRLLSKI